MAQTISGDCFSKMITTQYFPSKSGGNSVFGVRSKNPKTQYPDSIVIQIKDLLVSMTRFF